MPSTAVILVGQARTFGLCFDNQYWFLYRHLKDPVFYVFVEDEPEAGAMDLLLTRYPADRVHLRRVKTPTDLPVPDPKHALHTGYCGGPPAALVRTLWNFNEAWKWIESLDSYKRHCYYHDPFVKVRMDAYFSEFTMPSMMPSNEEAFGLWWERYGGINDRLAFFGLRAAKMHFTTYDRLQQILDAGCPLHGETLMAGSLELSGCTIHHVLRAWLCLKKTADEKTWCKPFAHPWEKAEFARTTI